MSQPLLVAIDVAGDDESVAREMRAAAGAGWRVAVCAPSGSAVGRCGVDIGADVLGPGAAAHAGIYAEALVVGGDGPWTGLRYDTTGR